MGSQRFEVMGVYPERSPRWTINESLANQHFRRISVIYNNYGKNYGLTKARFYGLRIGKQRGDREGRRLETAVGSGGDR